MRYILSNIFFFLVNTTRGYLLPNPPGRYNVTLTTGPLIDHTRNNANASTPTLRALMLSIFEPATCASTVPVAYMPNKTASYQGPFLQNLFNIPTDLTPLFLSARLPICPNTPSTCSPLDDHPILLFSPGYSFPRLYYNVLASAIASSGFTVITIDHPDDANIITYPDGHAVYGNAPSNPTDNDFTRYVYPRVADASFIIDQLSNATAMAEILPHRGPRPFPTDRIAMLGHSLGGAAAVIASGQDARIRGAIDWDGTLFGSLPPEGLSKPVLYVSEANATDPSWVAAWPHLKGPKLWIEIANTTHESFSDAGTLVKAAGMDLAALEGLLGTIDPGELVGILAAYTKVWMDGVFGEKVSSALLEWKGMGRFPEVEIVTETEI
jgi:dienelactone hydrolase